VKKAEDGIHVSFGANEGFVAWSTGTLPASVTAAADEASEKAAPPVAAKKTLDKTLEKKSTSSILPPDAQRQQPRITASWDNATIQEVIAQFQAISGYSIILGKDINVNISAEIRDRPWDEAFAAVLGAYGLSVQQVQGGILRVDAPATLAAIDSLEERITQ